MADAVVTTLFKLEADSAQLRSDLNKVNKELGKTENSAKQTQSTFAQMGEGLKGLARNAGLGGLVSGFESVQSSVSGATKAIGGLTKSTETATKTTSGLAKAFKLLLGPVGLILAAVGALGAAFLSTQRGQDAFNKVVQVGNAIFQRTIGVVQDIATSIVDTFQKSPKEIFETFKNLFISQVTNRINGAIELFKSLGTVMRGVFGRDLELIKEGLSEAANANLQLLTGIKDAGKETAQFFKDSIEAGLKIAELQKQISESETTLKKDLAILNAEREKELELARDTTKSLEDQLEANKRVQSISQDIANRQISQKKDELALVKQINALNDTDRKDQQKELDLEAEIFELQTRARSENLRLIIREKTLIAEIQKRNKEIADEKFGFIATEEQLIEKAFQERKALLLEIKTEDKNVQKDINDLIVLLEKEKNDTIRQLNKDRLLQQFEDEFDFLETENKIKELKLKEELANFKGTLKEREALQKEFVQRQILLLGQELDKLQSLGDVLLTPEEQQALELRIQSLKTKIAELGSETIETPEAELTSLQDAFTQTADIIGDVFDKVFEGINAKAQKEIDAIDKALEANRRNQEEALELAERGNIEALAIERARQEELERQRQLALDRQEKAARRAIAIQQAIAAAQILVEALSPTGAVTLPSKLAVAAGAITALIGLIPAFEKGTDNAPGGLAMVDEKGAELRFGKDGKLKDTGSNKGARLVMTEKGDKIIPAHKSRKIMEDMALPRKDAEVDNLRLEKAVKGLRSNTNIVIDKKGLYVGIKGVKQQMTRAWQ